MNAEADRDAPPLRCTDVPSGSIVVFRRRLLAWSETFVARQALVLPTLRATFAGLSTDPSGLALLGDAARHTLAGSARHPRLARWWLSAFDRVDPDWVRAIAAERPMLVHAHFASSGASALPLARALGVPLIVTFHGYDVLQRGQGRRALARRRRVFEEAERLVAVSEFLRDALLEAGAPPERTVRHYIGTDVPGDLPDERARSGSPPTIVFVGRLVAHKGCADAIEAFARVRAALPAARLRVLGDGPERAALEARARAVGAEVTFLGVCPPHRVRAELAAARVLCNPSRTGSDGWQEAFGLVYVEAQALGTPALGYASGGVPEAIEHGVTGWTVPEGDVDALSERLVALLSDDALHARMSLAARRRVRERFDLRVQCASLEALYADAVADAAARKRH